METEVVDTTKEATDVELAKLKAENEKFRNEIKDIAGKRDEYKSQIKQFEDSKLIANGETQKLLDERTKELETLKADFEVKKKLADEFESYQKSKRDGLLAEIKNENLKVIANEIQGLDKLELFVKETQGVKSPDVDDGNAGGTIKLTDAEKAEMKELGMTEQMYIEVMIPRNAKLKEKLKQ